MRTRNQSQRQKQPSPRIPTDTTTKAVPRSVKPNSSRKSEEKNKQVRHSQCSDSDRMLEDGPKQKAEQIVSTDTPSNTSIPRSTSPERGVESFPHDLSGKKEDTDGSDWEDGYVPDSGSRDQQSNDLPRELVVEFDHTPTSKKKPIRRVSAEDKEFAELVHKTHLLCLLARGRLVDDACSDPLIQSALLSLLPAHLLNIASVPKLTANALAPVVNWFHGVFHVGTPGPPQRSFKSSLGVALENRQGTPEEVAALSVALFRALNLTARFVSIMDVASLKPDADMSGWLNQDATGIFNSSTLMLTRPRQVSVSPFKSSSRKLAFNDDITDENSHGGACEIRESSKAGQATDITQLNGTALNASASTMNNDNSDTCLTEKSEGTKRKGDLEFELQLEMALSASSAGVKNSNTNSELKDLPSSSSNHSLPLNRFKRIKTIESPATSHGISTAVGSRKGGPPLYWAEVFCNGETLTGKWVHVDAVNVIIDGADKVEAAIAACKRTLRYVVAFSGSGAKDVTLRYCMKWYKIASKRINSQWWEAVLAPMTKLESVATVGRVLSDADHKQSSMPRDATWNSLEDMELQTRALTEPLPTNQQAYRNHHLYAIERWLTKYQMLYPKGPILGYCSGNPVYPRSCVQMLHTKQRWLREGLQIRPNENPAKMVKSSLKLSKAHTSEPGACEEDDREGIIELYGKWQTEPLNLPHAANGIVPRNERGQVDVWSEKCLPPGTVHIRYPRMVPVAKRLGIDFAPAMVGFEFRNGRSLPVYEGIVVCSEFKDAIMEAYAEEEERREAEEKKRDEAQAVSRWYQLLSSILTRQRLKDTYGDESTSGTPNCLNQKDDAGGSQIIDHGDHIMPNVPQQRYVCRSDLGGSFESHVHTFPIEDQSFDEETSVRTKRCPCGFLVEVEEL